MRDYEYPSNLEIMEKWEYMSERESKINIEHIYVQRSKSERERGERELKRNKKRARICWTKNHRDGEICRIGFERQGNR